MGVSIKKLWQAEPAGWSTCLSFWIFLISYTLVLSGLVSSILTVQLPLWHN